jgi:two-component system copper resistance phosphate regulon response regulator CusR
VRILLVEDDAGIVNFIVKGLREAAYAVDVATDGEDALYQVSINEYDAIILDVMIPLKDGFEVCKELREKGLQTPVLMLTARDSVGDRIKGLDTGADDYLIKPFAFGELLARLRALLRRKEKQFTDSEITIGDLKIDSKSQRVWCDNQEISLTTKEFTILEYLANNAGRIIGREEISEHCWNENYDPFSNSIEVFINRLRKKIDTEGKDPLLHTKRGAGYILKILDQDEII